MRLAPLPLPLEVIALVKTDSDAGRTLHTMILVLRDMAHLLMSYRVQATDKESDQEIVA